MAANALIKLWRQDKQHAWEPDSPIRAVLDTLQELKLLSAHIRATAESRLTGAGILFIASEAEFPPTHPVDECPPGEVEPDPLDGFIDSLIATAAAAYVDRSSPAARVPMVVQIPGEYLDKTHHMTFDLPFDDRVLGLRTDAIHRLALGRSPSS